MHSLRGFCAPERVILLTIAAKGGTSANAPRADSRPTRKLKRELLRENQWQKERTHERMSEPTL